MADDGSPTARCSTAGPTAWTQRRSRARGHRQLGWDDVGEPAVDDVVGAVQPGAADPDDDVVRPGCLGPGTSSNCGGCRMVHSDRLHSCSPACPESIGGLAGKARAGCVKPGCRTCGAQVERMPASRLARPTGSPEEQQQSRAVTGRPLPQQVPWRRKEPQAGAQIHRRWDFRRTISLALIPIAAARLCSGTGTLWCSAPSRESARYHSATPASQHQHFFLAAARVSCRLRVMASANTIL